VPLANRSKSFLACSAIRNTPAANTPKLTKPDSGTGHSYVFIAGYSTARRALQFCHLQRSRRETSPHGAGGLRPRFQPIGGKIIVRRFDRRMAFVPEGQADRSLARSAWRAPSQKRRPVGYRCDLRSCAHRFEDWRTFRRERLLGLAAPDHTVPYGTVLSKGRCPRHFVPSYDRLSRRDAVRHFANSI
jgi:hypothetical protein